MVKFIIKTRGQNIEITLDSLQVPQSQLLHSLYSKIITSNQETLSDDDLLMKHFLNQIKLIYKGKTLAIQLDQPISTLLQITSSRTARETKEIKIMLLFTSQEEIETLENQKIKHNQASLNYARALATRPKYEVTKTGFVRTIKVLNEFQNHDKARDLLQRIRDDPSIYQIMKEREWRVGTLSELHPNRDSSILGYNQNKGIVIALRLRTDALDGFRSYQSIVKVMLHELAHMIWSDHDNNFHALNRQLNRDYERYQGSTLSSRDAVASFKGGATSIRLVPGIEASTSVLGGQKKNDSSRPMREVLAEAALLRLTGEEQLLVDGCGHHDDKSNTSSN